MTSQRMKAAASRESLTFLVHFAEQISGALQIPLVRLLGQSPAGLNSTGESDLRTYYDNISKRQENDLREGVNLILRVLAMSLGIKLPDNFNFNFVPLWQMDQTEKTDVADKSSRFILEVESRRACLAQGCASGAAAAFTLHGYWTNIDDKMIEEASDVAEPPEPVGPDASRCLPKATRRAQEKAKEPEGG